MNDEPIGIDLVINFDKYRASLKKVEEETQKTIDSISSKKAKADYDNIKVAERLNAEYNKSVIKSATATSKILASLNKQEELARKQVEQSTYNYRQNLMAQSVKDSKKFYSDMLNIKIKEMKEAEAKAEASAKWQSDLRINSFKQELKQKEALQKQADAKAKVAFDKTMAGAMENGTTFGHKVYTTASYMAAGVALYGVATAMRSVVEAALDYDTAIIKNAAVLNATSKQAKDLADANRQIAISYGGSIAEIDEASLVLGRAGVEIEDLAAATKLIIQMATVTGDSFEKTSKVVSTFTTVFKDAGYQVEKLGGLLAYAANASKMSTEDLGTFANYGLITAKSMNMSAESVLALATAFSNIGMNASTVGTQIRKFEVIMNSSSEKVQKFWSILGESQKNTMAQIKSGGKVGEEAFNNLVKSIQNMDETAFMNATSGMEILTASFLKNIRVMGSKYSEHLKLLKDGGALLDIQAGKAAQSISKQFERATNNALTMTNSFTLWVLGTDDVIDKYDKLEAKIKSSTKGTKEYIDAIKELYDLNNRDDIFTKAAKSFLSTNIVFREYYAIMNDGTEEYIRNADKQVYVNKRLDKSIIEQKKYLVDLSGEIMEMYSNHEISADTARERLEFVNSKLKELTKTAKEAKKSMKAIFQADDTEFLVDLQDTLDSKLSDKLKTNVKRIEEAQKEFEEYSSTNNVEKMEIAYKKRAKLVLENVKLNIQLADYERAEKAKSLKEFHDDWNKSEEEDRQKEKESAELRQALDKAGYEFWKELEAKKEKERKQALAKEDKGRKEALDKQKAMADKIKSDLNISLAGNKANDSQMSIDTNRQENVQSIMKAIEAADKLNESKAKTNLLADLHLRIQKESAKYSEDIYNLNEKYNKDLIESNEKILELQTSLAESTMDWADGLTGVAANIAAVGKAMAKIDVNEKKSIEAKTKLENDYQEKRKEYAKQYGELSNEVAKLDTNNAKSKELLEAKNTQNQLEGYSKMAGAISQMFEQGSKEAAAFRIIQDGLALSAAVTAIASAGTGDPYTAIPRIIAMTAIMASLLQNIGQNFIAGGGTTMSSDTFSSMDESVGTGTSFGMVDKASESISNSMDILSDFAEPQFRELEKLNRNFLILGNSIEKFVNQAVYSGVTSSSDFTPSFSSSDNVSKALDSIINMSLENSLLGWATGGFSILFDTFSKITSPEKAIENILLSAVTGAPFDFASLLLNTFGGDTKTSTALKDYGAIINEQLITTAIDSIMSDAYQTVRTVVSTSYWDWGWRTDTKIIDQTVTGELDSILKDNLTMVFGDVYTSIVDAAKVIGLSESAVVEDLSDFLIPLAKISFDKSGDEIQKDFEAYIGSVTDLVAEDALNGMLDSFRQVGEGLAETLMRVATEVNVVQTLLNTVDTLSIDSQNILNASQNLIMLSGSLEDFSNITSAYYDSYFSDAEKLEDTTRILGSVFKELGVAAPKTYQEFRNIVESLDLNTSYGQETYITLMKISDAFREIGEASLNSEENIKYWQDSFKTQEELAAEMIGGFYDAVVTSNTEASKLLYRQKGSIWGFERYFTTPRIKTAEYSKELEVYLKNLGIYVDTIYKTTYTTTKEFYKLAETYEELSVLFEKMSNDADGLTDAELEALEANKAYIESLDKLAEATEEQYDNLMNQLELITAKDPEVKLAIERQRQLDALTDDRNKLIQEQIYLAEDLIKAEENAINSRNNAISALDSLINSSSSASTLRDFNEAMTNASKVFASGDIDGFTESLGVVGDTISALDDINNFSSSSAQAFAKARANLTLSDYSSELTGQVDYLESISDTLLNSVLKVDIVNGLQFYTNADTIYSQMTGFATGGYTGDVSTNAVAGLVHGQEFVVNAKTTKALGLNNNDGGLFVELLNEMKDVKALNIKMASNSDRQLNTTRAILSETVGV